MFGGMLGDIWEGLWGCFAGMFEEFWRDLGGKHVLETFKNKRINKFILIVYFVIVLICIFGYSRSI